MKVLFMGTPQLAARILEGIAGAHEICGLFCQPDRPAGRRGALTPPEAKFTAQRMGVAVFQPESLKAAETLTLIKALAPELIAVAAYGKILPKEILNQPPFGCVNIHASLLPKYRGASPLQHALLNGETATGVTAIQMNEGLDTGDILGARPFEILESDDANRLYERAAQQGTALLSEVLAEIADGRATRAPQDNAQASFAPMLTKEMGLFDFDQPAREIFNRVRALCRWPVAYFMFDGYKVKVHAARCLPRQVGAPGEILSVNPLVAAARDGAVELVSLTPAGGRTMPGGAFGSGRGLKRGDSLRRP